MFAMLAVFFITRRRKKKTTDGLVYHNGNLEPSSYIPYTNYAINWK